MGERITAAQEEKGKEETPGGSATPAACGKQTRACRMHQQLRRNRAGKESKESFFLLFNAPPHDEEWPVEFGVAFTRVRMMCCQGAPTVAGADSIVILAEQARCARTRLVQPG